jgi:hypothetical protein
MGRVSPSEWRPAHSRPSCTPFGQEVKQYSEKRALRHDYRYTAYMPTHVVRKELAGADADAVWALLGDLTNIDWMTLTERVEVFGSGPGMRRRLHGRTGSPVTEHLLSHDAGNRRMVYELVENNPLPADPYTVTAVVQPTSNGSVVSWTVDFESASTADEAKVVGGIDAIYPMIAGWLREAVAS